jgi:hypothetical protein
MIDGNCAAHEASRNNKYLIVRPEGKRIRN